MEAGEARVAVAVLRAWNEERSDVPLRIRVTRRQDVTSPDEESTVVSSVEDACALVREWLEEFSTDTE
jgi:hypothetical protein